MTTYDLFGFEHQDLELIKAKFNAIEGVDFIEHESEFFGIYFKAKRENGESFQLYENFFDGEWHEDEHRNCLLLLSVSEVSEPDFLFDLNRQVDLKAIPLRRTEILEENGERLSRKYVYQDGDFVLVNERVLKRRIGGCS